MKLIYKWDSQSVFSGTKLVEDDYQLQAGETFSAIPQPNLMPVKWNGSAWQSATQEEHDAYVKQQQAQFPQQPQEPTKQDAALQALGQQVGTLTVANQQTTKLAKQAIDAANALGQQMALMISNKNTTTANGGN